MSGLLERLERHKDDRGLMAGLRCTLVESKRHRAWPALARIGVKIDDGIASFIAGLYATHPMTAEAGNFGGTCRIVEKLRREKRGDDGKVTPTERRFQLLLAAERGPELEGRILRFVLMARPEGIPVNYEKLAADLRYWNDRTRTEWASAFWAPGEEERQ